jgi:hypothetical protein
MIWFAAILMATMVMADAPIFINLQNGQWFNLTQDVPFLYYPLAADAGGHYPLNFSAVAWGTPLKSFSLHNHNSTAGIMAFTPNNLDIGDPATGPLNYSYTVLAKDTQGIISVVSIKFKVQNVNDPPNVTWWFPLPNVVNIRENVSVGFHFNYSMSDPDIPWGDRLNASWYFDGILNVSSNKTNGSWVYHAGYCSAGMHNVSLKIIDLNKSSDVHNWTVNINNTNRPPVFSSAIANLTWSEDKNLTNNLSLLSHFYDLDYLECSGQNKDSLEFTVSGNSHVTVSINQTSFMVSFIPAADWFGVEVIKFNLNDSQAYASSNFFRLNVSNVNDAPVLGLIGSRTLAVGARFVYQVIATDADNKWGPFQNLHYWSNSPIFTIDSNTGWINFTPDVGDIGAYTFNISVNDSILKDTEEVTFTVVSNHPPNIYPIGSQFASEGFPFATTVNATDIDNDTIHCKGNVSFLNVVSVPRGNGSATCEISFTPAHLQVGLHFVKITVNDTWGAINSTSFNLTVSHVNYAPTFANLPTVKARINRSRTFNITATDANEDDILTFNATFTDSAPFFDIDHAVAVSPATSHNIINVTNVSFVGVHYVNISVTDDDQVNPKSHSQLVKFNITVNRKPRIFHLNDSEAEEDYPFTLFVSAFDEDQDNLTFDTNATFFNITYFNATTGLINFTPTQQDVGNFSIRINVSDGFGGYNWTVFWLNITGFNDPPYFVNLQPNYTLLEDHKFLLYVIGYDEETANLSMWSNDSLFNMTWHNSTTFLINITPIQQNVGNRTVNLTLTDGTNNISKLVIFHIVEVNDAPVIISYVPNSTKVSVAENRSILFNVTEVYDEENDTLSFKYYFKGQLKSNNRSWLFTPTFCDSGNFNVTVVVKDIHNASTAKSWNLTINNTNRGPFLNRSLPKLRWPEDHNLVQNLSLMDYFYDPDYHECNGSNKDTLSYRAYYYHVLVLIGPGSLVSFYPSADWNGVEKVYFTLNDTHNLIYSNNMTLNVTAVNDIPFLRPIPDQDAQVGEPVTVYVNASDVDGDRLFFSANTLLFNITNISLQLGLINFTVTGAMVGNHTINISVSDGLAQVSRLVLFSFNGTNLPPNITRIYPYGWPISSQTVFQSAYRSLFPQGTRVNISENRSIFFNHTTVEPEHDPLTYRWLLDGVLQAVNASWLYHVGWFDSGFRNVTLEVSDYLHHKDSFYWNVSVKNVNRLPTFGTKQFTDYAHFSPGSVVRTNITRQLGNITLAKKNATAYYRNGTYVSPVIDFQTGTDSSLARPYLNTVRWTATTPLGTDILLQTRTSGDSVTWSDWSNAYTQSSGSEINFSHPFVQNSSPTRWNTRYIQYRANLTTTNRSLTPILQSAEILYTIADFNIIEGYSVANWIDLDDYFVDPDNDSLTFNTTNLANLQFLQVSIDSNHMVTLDTQSQWSGTAQFQFLAKDTKNASNSSVIRSNFITVVVKKAPQSQTPRTGGGGGSSRTVTITRTKLENVTKPISLELLVPKPLIVTSDFEIIAPLELTNNGNVTLKGINLKAYTAEPNVTLTFSKSFFNQLASRERSETQLTIKLLQKKRAPFMINVTAQSTEPYFRDSAIISINPLSLPQSLNDSVRFVRDLLETNPECLELNELMTEAYKAIADQQYSYAKEILTKAVDACRYLISARKSMVEQPALLGAWEVVQKFLKANILPISLIAAVTVFLTIYSIIVIKRHGLKKT